MLLLRPHHINCIFFYKGLGYDEEFVEGMNNIIYLLNKTPSTKVKLITKCDDLCFNCPNKQSDNICLADKKVKELDFNTLKLYGLKENNEYVFNEIINTIYKNFDKNKFHKICSSCNWYKSDTCCETIILEQSKLWNL